MSNLSLIQEKKLLARLQAGEQAAVREFYDAFSARLYRCVIYPRLGVADLAEDVLRDTFLTAMEKIASVTWRERSLYYWLSRIAYNKVIDVHRGRKRTEKFVQGFAPHVELNAPDEDAESELIAEEQRRVLQSSLREALERLNPRYREAVELRFLGANSRELCAQRMQVSLGNFDVILFRALKRLRAILEEAQGEQTP